MRRYASTHSVRITRTTTTAAMMGFDMAFRKVRKWRADGCAGAIRLASVACGERCAGLFLWPVPEAANRPKLLVAKDVRVSCKNRLCEVFLHRFTLKPAISPAARLK